LFLITSITDYNKIHWYKGAKHLQINFTFT
jgi:hypothetical protein